MADAPLLGGTEKDKVELDADVFGAPFNGSLVHECVVAELAARRRVTHATRTRGMVRGGGAKPWRQKGTGRARQGTIRAPQFTGGGVAFPPMPRSFDLKVNKKAMKAALRSALSDHAQAGTIALVDPSTFDAPSTKDAVALLEKWGKKTPTVIVVADGEESLAKSFRNLQRVIVTLPSELEVAHIVWARSLLVSQAALDAVQQRAAR